MDFEKNISSSYLQSHKSYFHQLESTVHLQRKRYLSKQPCPFFLCDLICPVSTPGHTPIEHSLAAVTVVADAPPDTWRHLGGEGRLSGWCFNPLEKY